MIFYLNNKDYFVNVGKTFDLANQNDYIDTLDVFGVIVHSLSNNPEFDNSTVMIMYDSIKDKISVEVNDTKNDAYLIVGEEKIGISPEERDLIVEKLQCDI